MNDRAVVLGLDGVSVGLLAWNVLVASEGVTTGTETAFFFRQPGDKSLVSL